VHLLAQLIAVATDAKRLQGQSSSAWVIAILRGCLLVPIFEEVFFRGLLLSWLNRHMRSFLRSSCILRSLRQCTSTRLCSPMPSSLGLPLDTFAVQLVRHSTQS
jgi:hypothetical protein